MHISKILGINPTTQYNKNNTKIDYNRAPFFNISMPAALNRDTVSFTSTEKKLTTISAGVSMKVARSINSYVESKQPKVSSFMYKYFGDLLVTDLKPNNPILAIKDRAKSPTSIMEKSATRGWNKKSEILENMTDLNGVKIVMRDGRKKAVQQVLSRFIKLIENEEIELLEIENKRPNVVRNITSKKKEQYDYTSSSFLESLKQLQEQKWLDENPKTNKKVKLDLNDYTEMNYMAIHFLFKLPGEARPFELMIMGKDINALKELDDKLFKILNNKCIDKRYKPLKQIILPLMEDGNKKILDIFNQYRRDAFIFQRKKEPTSYANDNNTIDYFLPLTYDIPPKFDLNNLNRIMLECDAKAKNK